MKLAQIELEALAISERERASLAAKLLDTLPPPGTDVSDDEVERRERELESGQVDVISHEEYTTSSIRNMETNVGSGLNFAHCSLGHGVTFHSFNADK